MLNTVQYVYMRGSAGKIGAWATSQSKREERRDRQRGKVDEAQKEGDGWVQADEARTEPCAQNG